MNMTIRTAAMLAALVPTVAAAQVQMPKEMQGEWCEQGDYYFVRAPDGGCEVASEKFTVTAGGYSYVDGPECVAIRIATFERSRGARKNPWGPGYRITFRCKATDASPKPSTMTQTQKWYTAKGNLFTGR